MIPLRHRFLLASLLVAMGLVAAAALVGCAQPPLDLSGVLRLDRRGQGSAGTATVLRQDPDWTFAITCAHVALAGPLAVGDAPIEILAVDAIADLAIFRVALVDRCCAYRPRVARRGEPVCVAGWARTPWLGPKHPDKLHLHPGSIAWAHQGTWLGTTAPVCPGMSGSPVLSPAGELLGIVRGQRRFSPNPIASEVFDSFTLATGAESVRRLWRQLQELDPCAQSIE